MRKLSSGEMDVAEFKGNVLGGVTVMTQTYSCTFQLAEERRLN